jgi:imidazolonepropionase-like amidohydrolase
MAKSWILTLGLAVIFCCGVQSKGQNQILVVEGGTLIDGTGASPVKDAVVVIEGNRFKAVGAKGKISYPPNAKVVKADGKTILPGLIESHMHLREWMPPMFLRFGVTTVYDLTNYTGWIVAQREALKKGRIKGPRLYVTGRIVDGPLEYYRGRIRLVDAGGERTHWRTTEEVKVAIRHLVAQGVDAIKINEAMSPEQITAATEEAGKFGLQVCGHATDARVVALAGLKCIAHMPSIIRATIADPASLAKINELKEKDPGAYWRAAAGSYENLMEPALFDPLIQLLVKNGVYLGPTLANGYADSGTARAKEWAAAGAEFVRNTPGLDFVPLEVRQGWMRAGSTSERPDVKRQEEIAEGYQKITDFIRRFVRAGGKITAGTDRGDSVPGRGLNQDMIPFVPGLGLHQEMQALVDAGLTPMQVILATTKWAAEEWHKEKDLGTIEPGKLADLIVVNGDPLANIRAAQNVALVILDGKIADTSYDPQFKNPLPRPFNTQRGGPSLGPEVSSVTPETAPAGGPAVTLEVAGSKFTPRSVVRFDTSDLKTQYVDEMNLTAVIDRARLQRYGTYAITVVNPGSGGGTSNVLYIVVGF